MSKVIDIMHDKVIYVSLSTAVIEVAYRMKISGMTLIPVCSKGKFRGVITAEDIVYRHVANGTDPVTAHASSVMNGNYPFISPDTDIAEAARIMSENKIQILPVIQDTKLRGLVTLYDVTQAV